MIKIKNIIKKHKIVVNAAKNHNSISNDSFCQQAGFKDKFDASRWLHRYCDHLVKKEYKIKLKPEYNSNDLAYETFLKVITATVKYKSISNDDFCKAVGFNTKQYACKWLKKYCNVKLKKIYIINLKQKYK